MHHTKFDAVLVQMQHGVRSAAWSVHARPKQHGLLDLDPFVVNACHPQSRFQKAFIPLLQKNKIPNQCAPSSLAMAHESSCEPYQRSPSDLPHLKMPKDPQLLSHASNTMFDCFVFARVARFGCIRCKYKTQTYCPYFIDDLMMNELSNLSCKCACLHMDLQLQHVQYCELCLR